MSSDRSTIAVLALACLLIAGCKGADKAAGAQLPSRASGVPSSATSVPAPSSTPAPASDSASSAASVPVTLPIVYCPTGDGGLESDPPQPTSPTTTTVEVPASLAHEKLAIYRDYENVTGSIAPAGWACEAAIGAASDSDFVVAPNKADLLADQSASPSPTAPRIEVRYSGYSAGYATELVCGLILPASAADDQGGCAPRPAGELVQKINANTISFIDPPALGSPYRTIGRVVYFPADGFPTAYVWLCNLPDTQQAICDANEAELVSTDPPASPQAN